jgi:hypothetical protein
LKQDQNAPKTDNGSIEKHTDSDLETQDTAGNTTPSERSTVNSSTQKPVSAPQAPLSSPAPHEAQTNEERASDMDKQLQESLSKFDGKLLKQRTLLEGLRDADAGGEPLGGAVGDVGETGDADSNAQGGTSEESRPTISASEDLPEASTGTPGKPERGGTRPATIPPDIPDGRDDDIVARQIREAAMREKDPKLREKLWEEYRKYKQSSGANTP